MLLIPAALFVLGAIVASFVGVLSGRLNTGQSFLVGRSRCDACAATLSPRALVPILSYVVSGGRAHCCGARISVLSPLTELLLGALFVLSYLTIGLTIALPFFLISLSVLLALVLYDLTHQILPSSLLVLFVATSAMAGFLESSSLSAFTSSLVTAVLVAASLAAVHFFSDGRAMGFADAPLSFGLAILSGPAALSGFVFSFWIGAVVGIFILLRRPVGSRMSSEVPLAPYLAAGSLLAYFPQWHPFVLIAAFSRH